MQHGTYYSLLHQYKVLTIARGSVEFLGSEKSGFLLNFKKLGVEIENVHVCDVQEAGVEQSQHVAQGRDGGGHTGKHREVLGREEEHQDNGREDCRWKREGREW